jgi:hypothetical protein
MMARMTAGVTDGAAARTVVRATEDKVDPVQFQSDFDKFGVKSSKD